MSVFLEVSYFTFSLAGWMLLMSVIVSFFVDFANDNKWLPTVALAVLLLVVFSAAVAHMIIMSTP